MWRPSQNATKAYCIIGCALPAASPATSRSAPQPKSSNDAELGTAIPATLRGSSYGQRAETRIGGFILRFIFIWRCMKSHATPLFASGCLDSGSISSLLGSSTKYLYLGLIWPAVIHSLPFTIAAPNLEESPAIHRFLLLLFSLAARHDSVCPRCPTTLIS